MTCQGCEGRSAAAVVSLGNKVAAAASLPWGRSAEENIVTSLVLNRVISFEPGRMSNLNWVSILGVGAPFLDQDLKWVSNLGVRAPFSDRLQFSELSVGSSPC